MRRNNSGIFTVSGRHYRSNEKSKKVVAQGMVYLRFKPGVGRTWVVDFDHHHDLSDELLTILTDRIASTLETMTFVESEV